MDRKKITEDFFQFEMENHLFDITDKKGHRVWEIIRVLVFGDIVRTRSSQMSEVDEEHVSLLKRNVSLLKRIGRVLRNELWSIGYYFVHWNTKYMFYIASRNYDNGVYFDKIADSVLEAVDRKNAFIIETYYNLFKKEYKYGKVSISVADTLSLLYHPTYNMSRFLTLLKENYPDVTFNPKRWEKQYALYHAHYIYYKFLFKTKRIKKCFMVQNGLQYGMFAAARACNVDVVELQHGEVAPCHFLYSYPDDKRLIGKLSKPSTFLLLGDFWKTQCNMPGVNIDTIGNNYYYPEVAERNGDSQKGVVVISSSVHGEVLSDLLLETMKENPHCNIHFYYKLHPVEAERENEYVNRFKAFDNIEVVGGSVMMSGLLGKAAFVLSIQSTVEFEALSVGVKVMVYKRSNYQVLDALFEEEDVHLIDSSKELLDTYNRYLNKPVKSYGDYFFKRFDPKVLKKYL